MRTWNCALRLLGRSYCSLNPARRFTSLRSLRNRVPYGKIIPQVPPYTDEDYLRNPETSDYAISRFKNHEEQTDEPKVGSLLRKSIKKRTADANTLPKRSDKTDHTNIDPDHIRASKALPRSPIVTRYECGPRPMKPLTEERVSRKLTENPWAQILASPLRRCSASHVRLPRDLLTRFSFAKHPFLDEVHLLPVEDTDLESLRLWRTKSPTHGTLGLPKSQNHAVDEEPNSAPNSALAAQTESPAEGPSSQDETRSADVSIGFHSDEGCSPELAASGSPTEEQETPVVKWSGPPPGSYFLTRHSLLQQVSVASTKKPGRPTCPLPTPLIPMNAWRRGGLPKHTKWKFGVPDLLLHILQQRVIAALENVLSIEKTEGSALLYPLDRQKEDHSFEEKAVNGAVLRFRGINETSDSFQKQADDFGTIVGPVCCSNGITSDGSGVPIALLKVTSTHSLPVFDMESMFQPVRSTEEDPHSSEHMTQLLHLLRTPESLEMPKLWLLRSCSISSRRAIIEIWRLYQYVTCDLEFNFGRELL